LQQNTVTGSRTDQWENERKRVLIEKYIALFNLFSIHIRSCHFQDQTRKQQEKEEPLTKEEEEEEEELKKDEVKQAGEKR
jgi:hypothetical protein